jgi:hypothetical protein
MFSMLNQVRSKFRKRTILVVALILTVIFAGGTVIAIKQFYTPLTSAFVRNNTTRVVTIDNCEDYSITLNPGQSAGVEPWTNPAMGCTVYLSQSDKGLQSGCLYFDAQNGSVVVNSTSFVSNYRKTTKSCAG